MAALLATEERWRGVRTALVMDIGTNTEISLIHDGAHPVGLLPFGAGAGRRPHRLRHARRRRRDRARGAAATAASAIAGHRRASEPVGCAARACWMRWPRCCEAGIVDAARAHRRAVMPHVRERRAASAQVMLAPGRALHPGRRARRAARQGGDPRRRRLLLREAGLAEDDIERFVIAGAFGAYIDVGERRRASGCSRICRASASSRSAMPPASACAACWPRAARARAPPSWRARCRYVELSRAPGLPAAFPAVRSAFPTFAGSSA